MTELEAINWLKYQNEGFALAKIDGKYELIVGWHEVTGDSIIDCVAKIKRILCV